MHTFKELFHLKGKELALVSNQNTCNLEGVYKIFTSITIMKLVRILLMLWLRNKKAFAKYSTSNYGLWCAFTHSSTEKTNYGLRCAFTHSSTEKTFKQGDLTNPNGTDCQPSAITCLHIQSLLESIFSYFFSVAIQLYHMYRVCV